MSRSAYPAPPGRGPLIGNGGFGVVVTGESMAGRGIHAGDVVWVDPGAAWNSGDVVLAFARSDAGAGLVVKTYVDGCLHSDTETSRSPPRV